MPPKHAKKTPEDAADIDVEIVETLSPFEKQMMEKWDKMHGALTDIQKNVSKITKHLLAPKENTTVKEVVSDTTDTSAEILKEMAGTLKEILKTKESAPVSQQADFQGPTQILIEQEIEKIKQSMIQTWNSKLQRRAAEFWQMVRNENTAKIYETWKNSSPVIIPRKLQMNPIREEPLAQTKLREKQVLLNLETELELMKLRGESHQEKYQQIDKEMEDIINKKINGQRRELLNKLWKEDCVREETRSLDRWENSNKKWTDKYEAEFLKFFEQKNPFVSDEGFLPPQIRKQKQQYEQTPDINEMSEANSGNDADVIITGVSTYAQAAQKPPATNTKQSTQPGTTYIGKKVRFNKSNTNTTKPYIPKNPTAMPQRNPTRRPLLNNPPIPINTQRRNQPAPEQADNAAQFNNRYPQCPPPPGPPSVPFQNAGYNTPGINNANYPQSQTNAYQNTGYNPNQNNTNFLYQSRTPYNNR